MFDIKKYKRLFGIEVPLDEFSPEELKRRWRVLCKKYHPDHGGIADHFDFVQEAYVYLKKHCKGEKDSQGSSFNSEIEIEEIRVKTMDGDGDKDGYIYLWDVGEADFQKRYEHQKRNPDLYRGRNLNVRG